MIIETEREYEILLEVTGALINVDSSMSPNTELLEILGNAIEAYETIHYPIAKPSEEDVLEFRKQQEGL